MPETAAIVLAAGRGTRMRSHLPKVLHTIAGRSLIEHVLTTTQTVGLAPTIVVVGYGAGQVREVVGPDVLYAEQAEQLGTGHAVAQALPLLETMPDVRRVVVCCGDMPLVKADTFRRLLQIHREQAATMTMVATELSNPTGYGRIIRGADGSVREIVEEAAATPEQKAVRLVNFGVYCIERDWLHTALPRIRLSAKGEYYLTDLAAIAASDGARIAVVAGEPTEMTGINDRVQLAEAGATLRREILQQHMLAGVTIVDPASTYIDADVTIGMDAIIQPNTHLQGKTVIAEGCEVGPNSHLVDSEVGEGSRVWASVLESAKVGQGVRIGPFSHLRPGAIVDDGCIIGNYAEIKNSRLGSGTHMHHFSYVGDALLGDRVNVGAGTITCNLDSESGQKNRTIVGDRASIGSDTMLVAPVEVGPDAVTGAGSVVTRDVPAGALALGVPARVVRQRRQEDGNE